MSGTDKILAKLSADCTAECDAIYENARQNAEEIKKKARTEAQLKADEIISQAKKRAEEIIRLAESSAEMKRKQAELSEKVALLNSVLGDALSELENMDKEKYFSVLEDLAVKNASDGNGVLVISEQDAARAPSDFIERINERISGNASLSLSVSQDLRKKGIILVYGDIEINLTFKALIDAEEDTLKETAGKILFS